LCKEHLVSTQVTGVTLMVTQEVTAGMVGAKCGIMVRMVVRVTKGLVSTQALGKQNLVGGNPRQFGF